MTGSGAVPRVPRTGRQPRGGSTRAGACSHRFDRTRETDRVDLKALTGGRHDPVMAPAVSSPPTLMWSPRPVPRAIPPRQARGNVCTQSATDRLQLIGRPNSTARCKPRARLPRQQIRRHAAGDGTRLSTRMLRPAAVEAQGLRRRALEDTRGARPRWVCGSGRPWHGSSPRRRAVRQVRDCLNAHAGCLGVAGDGFFTGFQVLSDRDEGGSRQMSAPTRGSVDFSGRAGAVRHAWRSFFLDVSAGCGRRREAPRPRTR